MSETGNSKGVIIGVAIGTLAAIGGGFAFGSFVKGGSAPTDEAAAPAKAPPQKAGEIKALAPIVTNLREPSNLYVRLEASVMLAPDTPDGGAIAAKIADDLAGYLRTVAISELDGPTGFQFLKEDLKKRAIQLGGGKVRDLLLQSFIVQ